MGGGATGERDALLSLDAVKQKKSLLYYRSPGDSCIVSTNSLSCGKAARFSGFLQVREMGC